MCPFKILSATMPELIKLAHGYSRDQRLKMQMHTIYGAGIIETMMTV